jgi:hypothetical protein
MTLSIVKCTRCKRDCPSTDFYPKKKGGSYLNPRCRICVSELNNLRYMARRIVKKDGPRCVILTKICSCCKIDKLLDEFYKKKTGVGRCSSVCKVCENKRKKAAYHEDPKLHQYRNKTNYEKHREARIEAQHVYNETHRTEINLRQGVYNTEHRDEILEKARIKGKTPEHRAKVKTYFDRNPSAKIARNLRSRLNGAVRGKIKVGSAVRDLGCSIEFLKRYLESKFQIGMTWGNYGFKGWHIDHVVPLDSFVLTDTDQFMKACHYTNLQPLWWNENMSKGAKLDWEKNEKHG